MNTNQLTTATPRQIDKTLAKAYFDRSQAEEVLRRTTALACSHIEYRVEEGARFVTSSLKFGKSYQTVWVDLEAVESVTISENNYIATIDDVNVGDRTWAGREATDTIVRKYHTRDFCAVAELIADDKPEVAEALATLAEINATINACQDEFKARHGWNRYWLVTSSQGHIHSATNCSSCNKGRNATTFALVCDLSDAEASEAVDIFGAALCSVCFPDAPVEFTDEVKITQAQATAYFEGGIDAYREMIAKAEARKANSEQRKAEAAERKARIAEQDAIREAKFLEEIKRQNKEVI